MWRSDMTCLEAIVMRIRLSFAFFMTSLIVLFSTDKTLVNVLDVVADKFHKFRGASERIPDDKS